MLFDAIANRFAVCYLCDLSLWRNRNFYGSRKWGLALPRRVVQVYNPLQSSVPPSLLHHTSHTKKQQAPPTSTIILAKTSFKASSNPQNQLLSYALKAQLQNTLCLLCLRVVYLATMDSIILSAEAKAAIIANFELEREFFPSPDHRPDANASFIVEARKEKLRAMCEAQCASLRSRLERRVNRIPANMRQMTLVDLLEASMPATSAPADAAAPKAAPSNAAPLKAAPLKAAAAKAAPIKAAPSKKGTGARVSPPPTTPTISTMAKAKPATIKAAPKQTIARDAKTTTTRSKKRGSDELSNEDKENAAELAAPKKRVRAAAPKAAAPAPTTRATRATSRTKPAPAQILSPKDSAGNARSKPAARTTRPR